MTYTPLYTGNQTINSLCIEIAELVGRLSPDNKLIKSPTLHRELRIKTIYSSLYIEGNQLNEKTVTAILDGKRVLGNANDILEVENAKRAYELIPELDPYSINDLLLAHRIMTEGLVAESGLFRSGNVGVFDGDVLVHAGTPASYVPEVIRDLFDWLKKTDMHPLLASCVFQFEFEFCHPFADGNGRIGRLWHTLLLSKWRPALAWLPIEDTIRKHQSEYYAALAMSDRSGSSEAFVEFMLIVIRDSLKPFVTQKDSSEQQLIDALDYFRRNPTSTITALSERLGCSQRTAERIVAELKKQKRLLRIGSARSGIWEVHKDDR